MANPIIVPKKSTVSSKVPTTSDLALGEIAINHADKKLYARHPISGTVQEIGSLTAHSHDQLISVDSTADLELQNNGSVIITDGSVSTTLALSSTIARTITFPDKTGTVAFLDDVGSGGVQSIGASAADVLSIASGEITADDPGADRLLFWDDSESKLTHLTLGTALSISGTTINADTGSTTNNYTATNYWIPASAWIPRTTTGCGVDSRETSTNKQNFDELLFDAATDEFAQALHILPNTYTNGTITVRFYWTASSGSGAVVWGIQGRSLADDDALDTAFGTAQTVTDTLLAANDMHITSATSAVTIGGTPAANTPIQFQVYRDADAAGDTLAVDARLLGVEIVFN